MAWPVSPTNGQQTTIANVLYQYNSSLGAWSKVQLAQPPYISDGNNVTISGNLTIPGTMSAASFSVSNIAVDNITASGNVTAVNFNGNVVGNLTGIASNATFATLAATANTVDGANVTGEVAYAAIANSVSGANVVGQVSYAAVANSVAATGTSNLGPVGNIIITGGNANQILKTDGTGNLSWTDPTGGYFLHTQNSANLVWVVNHNLNRQYVTVEAIDANGNSYTGRYDYPTISYTNANSLTMTFTSAVAGYAAITGGGTNINSVLTGNSTPGGVNTQVQFNDAGALNGSSGLTFDKVTGTLSVANLQTTLLTTGSNTTAGTITGDWTLSSGSKLQATYADLAEYYRADQHYEPGTVLEFGGEFEVTLAQDETIKIAGVVSTHPAMAMNSTCPGNAVPVALQGRVPCKVRGTIRKGDMLVSGGNGYARPTTNPKLGAVIGKALQDYEGSGGVIEVVVGRL